MFNLNNIDLIHSRTEQAKIFGYAFFFWTSIFTIVNQKVYFKSLPKRKENDMKNRIVSVLHGIFSFWASFYIVTFHQPQFEDQNTQAIQLVLLISSSYFVYDQLACLYYKLSDSALVLHHIITISGQVIGIYYTYGGTSLMWQLAIGEISNFPMHSRCMLRTLGLRYTKLYEFLEWTYFFLYSFARGLFAPIMLYQSYFDEQTPMLIKISQIAGLLQSVYFINEIIKIVRKQMIELKQRKVNKIDLFWFKNNEKYIPINDKKKENVF